VLSDPGLDSLLDIAADDRVERLLDLAADERVERLLHRLDVLVADDRARTCSIVPTRSARRATEPVGGRLDRLLAEDHLASLEGLSSDDRVAAVVRVLPSTWIRLRPRRGGKR
jgi:hypothetical protein